MPDTAYICICLHIANIHVYKLSSIIHHPSFLSVFAMFVGAALQDAAGQSANCGIELQVFEGKKAQAPGVDGGGREAGDLRYPQVIPEVNGGL